MYNPIVLLIVLDAVGIRTLEYLLDHFPGQVHLPNLSRLGLGRLLDARHRHRFGSADDSAHATIIEQASATADSVVGHREMMGVIDYRTYDLFQSGFPERYITALEKAIGRKTMYNRMAGGMEAIEVNANEHAKTGHPIVYASKCDPLIQLAMDEAVIPVPEQHRIAETALKLALDMGIPMTRAIARAYTRNADGSFTRTANRHDAVLTLPGNTLVDILRQRGVRVVGVGKVSDLVKTTYNEIWKLTDHKKIGVVFRDEFIHPQKKDNNPLTMEGVWRAINDNRAMSRPKGTFVFANFVDTDSLWGHTRDVVGAMRCIEAFDAALPHFERLLSPGDLMIITADHGMEHRADYGYHSLESLPLLAKRIGYNRTGLGGLIRYSGRGLTEVGLLIAQVFNCADDFQQNIVTIPA